MIREAMQVDAAKVALANGKRFGLRCCLQNKSPQLAVELICKLWRGDPLVIRHDLVDVGLDFWMQD